MIRAEGYYWVKTVGAPQIAYWSDPDEAYPDGYWCFMLRELPRTDSLKIEVLERVAPYGRR